MRPATTRTRTRALALGAASLTALLGLGVPPTASATEDPADVSDHLARQLDRLAADAPTRVMVHGSDLAAARDAVAATGMKQSYTFERVGVVAAVGTRTQIEEVRREPGVTYVEGNQPIEFTGDTSHEATRGIEAIESRTGADGTELDGSGVSVAVIDTGIDPTHPAFADADGESAVVANLKAFCDPLVEALCHVQELPTSVDTDTLSVGGHGTHVSGIVAGRPTELSSGETVQGAAPGSSLVSLSTGAALFVIGANAAMEWVLENHEAPCGEGVPAADCPPIKVTNNSYGPSGGGEFDPQSTTAKLQRALADEGVVTVWANGNDGGDGSESLSNPPGTDPTGGIVSVASYFDQDTGTRDGVVSDFSSRGEAGDQATYPDLSAPGENITSACRPYLAVCATGLDFRNGPGPLDLGTFNTISGTSMAAPHVAGIVAQLFQARPDATPAEVEEALLSTAHKYTDGADYEPGGAGSTSYDKGHGLVDVVAAVDALTGG